MAVAHHWNRQVAMGPLAARGIGRPVTLATSGREALIRASFKVAIKGRIFGYPTAAAASNCGNHSLGFLATHAYRPHEARHGATGDRPPLAAGLPLSA